MRIQHNITAMNAYRNYSNNTSALAKNLEKLSSGYKINRAGDDAAGLAISEKMRAQISGLEQAQANANSGINLVQTAEGALTEVHDMLNRMVTLAEQSANGTYDDDVDRVQLQKEVDQLRTEIDRIADSSNFNGINLLDGSLALSDAVEASSTTEFVVSSGMDRILSTVMGDDELAAVAAGSKTILDSYNGAATKAQFQINLKEMAFSAVNGSTSATFGTLKIQIGGSDGFSIEIEVKGTGGGASSTSVNATVKFTLADGTVVSSATTGAVSAKSSLANAIGEILASKASGSTGSVKINGVNWNISNSSGKLTFKQVATPTTWDEAQTNFDVQVTWDDGSGSTSLLTNDVETTSSSGGSFTISNSMKAGTTVIKQGVPTEGTVRANTVFSITADDIKDGTQIVIGTKTYVLAVGASSVWSSAAVTALGSASSVKRVDLTSMDADNVDLNRALDTLCKTAGSSVNLAIGTASGRTTTVKFKLGVSDGENGVPTGIALVRASNATDNTATSAAKCVFDTLEKLAANFKIGVNTTTVIEAKEAGKGLTLQIGDTADSYNQLNVSINDCHAAAIGIGDIDISTQDGAAEAVDKIKDAINYVSDVRGTLGATQNRLDHTINNLSVMQENIQDAESTIRDVDVAEEMMEYTKNNILVQSAQAMLAQANQLPQGVLQLLQ